MAQKGCESWDSVVSDSCACRTSYGIARAPARSACLLACCGMQGCCSNEADEFKLTAATPASHSLWGTDSLWHVLYKFGTVPRLFRHSSCFGMPGRLQLCHLHRLGSLQLYPSPHSAPSPWDTVVLRWTLKVLSLLRHQGDAWRAAVKGRPVATAALPGFHSSWDDVFKLLSTPGGHNSSCHGVGAGPVQHMRV